MILVHEGFKTFYESHDSAENWLVNNKVRIEVKRISQSRFHI